MKISYNWLKQYVDFNLSAQDLAEVLTGVGLEVEDVVKFETIQGGLEGVVIGEVKECTKHPDADKLSVTKVDAGTGELLQIVCGAPNVAAGQKVVVALVGATLYPFAGEKISIKKAKIRGVESFGMICAEDKAIIFWKLALRLTALMLTLISGWPAILLPRLMFPTTVK